MQQSIATFLGGAERGEVGNNDLKQTQRLLWLFIEMPCSGLDKGDGILWMTKKRKTVPASGPSTVVPTSQSSMTKS